MPIIRITTKHKIQMYFLPNSKLISTAGILEKRYIVLTLK